MNNNKAIDSNDTCIMAELLKESVIDDLLDEIGIENFKKLRIIESYDYNNVHVGLIAEMKNRNTDSIERIVVDFVIGYPVTEQVYEAVYHKGSHCDTRIILYTKGSADLDNYGGEDDDAIKNLVENLNRYGTNIYLAKMKYNSNEGRFNYMVTAMPPIIVDYKLSKLPSEAKLKEEEFWELYYWKQMVNFYRSWETFTEQLHGQIDFGHWYGLCRVNLYAKWTEEGMFFEAEDAVVDFEYLEYIWNHKKHDLQALYPDAEVIVFNEPGKLPKFLIKLWSTPVQSLMNASIPEKKRLAGEILEKFDEFMNFIEDVLDDIDNVEIDDIQEALELVKTE